jgi:hypothetical protein
MVLTEFKIIFDELSVDLDQAFFASVVDGGSESILCLVVELSFL